MQQNDNPAAKARAAEARAEMRRILSGAAAECALVASALKVLEDAKLSDMDADFVKLAYTTMEGLRGRMFDLILRFAVAAGKGRA